MERKQMTCPETGLDEAVDFERTPCGVVVGECSRFARGAVACSRACAADMDHRDRQDIDDRFERVLVVAAKPDAAMQRTIALVVDQLARDALTVEVTDVDTGFAPPPADYEAVVVIVPEDPKLARLLRRYVESWRDELASMPTFELAASTLDSTEIRRFALRLADAIPA